MNDAVTAEFEHKMAYYQNVIVLGCSCNACARIHQISRVQNATHFPLLRLKNLYSFVCVFGFLFT